SAGTTPVPRQPTPLQACCAFLHQASLNPRLTSPVYRWRPILELTLEFGDSRNGRLGSDAQRVVDEPTPRIRWQLISWQLARRADHRSERPIERLAALATIQMLLHALGLR